MTQPTDSHQKKFTPSKGTAEHNQLIQLADPEVVVVHKSLLEYHLMESSFTIELFSFDINFSRTEVSSDHYFVNRNTNFSYLMIVWAIVSVFSPQ